MRACAFQDARDQLLSERCSQADPKAVQFGSGLARSVPLLFEKLVQIECGLLS
jgi:hypothetical protein